MSWLDQPVLALDTETTGLDVESDRVVTYCLGYSEGVGQWRPSNRLINPGVPIPAEATAVHGITDTEAAGGLDPAKAFEELRLKLESAAASKTPVVGYNLVYDLTLLDREFHRHLGKNLPVGLVVIDVLVLHRRFDFTTGSRRLEDVAARNGIEFPAHDAESDALASLKLLHILADQNDLLGLVAPIDLHGRQTHWYVGQQNATHYKRIGNGQHSDEPNLHWPLIPHTTRQEAAA